MTSQQARDLCNSLLERKYSELKNHAFSEIERLATQGAWSVILDAGNADNRKKLVDDLKNLGFAIKQNLPEQNQIKIIWKE